MNMFPVKSRIVRGTTAIQAAIQHLASKGVWFEVTPEPNDGYRIKVKSEAEHFLPKLKDWEDASDQELLQLACNELPEEFSEWKTGDAIARDPGEIEIVTRGGTGFSIRTEVWVSFPENEA